MRFVNSQEYLELQSLSEELQLQVKRVRLLFDETLLLSFNHISTTLFLLFCLSLSPPSISAQQLKSRQSSVSPPPSSSEGPLRSDLWSSVPPSYRGYRLGSLFRHRHEISHFKYFLQDQDAR